MWKIKFGGRRKRVGNSLLSPFIGPQRQDILFFPFEDGLKENVHPKIWFFLLGSNFKERS